MIKRALWIAGLAVLIWGEYETVLRVVGWCCAWWNGK